MFRSGNAGGVSDRAVLLAASRQAILPNRRLPHVVTAIGDSRVDAVYLDPQQRNRNPRSALNWANALLGHRLVIGQTFGKSTDRTDHLFARIDAAIATGAGMLYVHIGVNNFAAVASSGNFTYVHAVDGDIVTIATVAQRTFDDIKKLSDKALRAGVIFVIENEIGGAALATVEKVGALNAYRQMLTEYADVTPGFYVHDAYAISMLPTTQTPTFRAGHAYDGVHWNSRGAFKAGKSLATLLDRIVPARPSILSRGLLDTPANGRRQLLANHIFATTTGGTAASGTTGPVPANFSTSLTAATATVSSGPNADGVGNFIQMEIAFTGAGEARLSQPLNGSSGGYNAALSPGDILEAVSEVEIIGNPAILASIALELQGYDGIANFGSVDGIAPIPITAADVGPDEPCVFALRTRPTTVLPMAGPFPYVSTFIRVRSTAAGSVTLRIRQIALRRRVAA